jgi:tRNA(Ile)-lysidine synthetase-like protein
MSLLHTFHTQLAALALPRGSALVAVSGGPDSVVLLDLLAASRDVHGLDLVVAHVDHGINIDSARVAEQVQTLATSYGLPFELGQLALGPGASEAAARVGRYAWLEKVCVRSGAGVIFTAHHADDQVETVLMRVLAGTGPAGLSGMAVISGRVVRPLLSVPRAELSRYAKEKGLNTWLDPANSDQRHLRSWIRTELLPMLRARVPDIDVNLQRTSRQAALDRAAWDAVLDVLPGLDLRTEREGISVAASSLGGYDSPLAEGVILAMARRAGCQLGPARITRVLALLETGTSGAWVPLGGGWAAELAFDRLRITTHPPAPGSGEWQLEGRRGEAVWGRWCFRWSPAIAPAHHARGGMRAWFTFEAMSVRAWSPGERLRPLGGSGRKLIVRCFQERRVPRSRRASWPVLTQNEEIIWIPGVCRSDALLPVEGTEALRVDAEYA